MHSEMELSIICQRYNKEEGMMNSQSKNDTGGFSRRGFMRVTGGIGAMILFVDIPEKL